MATPGLRSLCMDATLQRDSMETETTAVRHLAAPDPMEEQPTTVTGNGGPSGSKRRACEQPLGVPATSTQDTFVRKRDSASAVPAVAPGVSPLYKVAIKPRECFNVTTLPNRVLQATLDSCLQTNGFQGFAIHRPTNTISVWVRSLADVDRLCGLKEIPLPAGTAVGVQAYLISGSDLRRYVVFGVDPDESPETLAATLTCTSHKILQARYMGRGRTCLVTLQGPVSAPARITYWWYPAIPPVQVRRGLLLPVFSARPYAFLMPAA